MSVYGYSYNMSEEEEGKEFDYIGGIGGLVGGWLGVSHQVVTTEREREEREEGQRRWGGGGGGEEGV